MNVGDLKFRHPWFLVGKIRVGGKEITLMVKPNMRITAARRLAEPWMFDHAAVVAEIELSEED